MRHPFTEQLGLKFEERRPGYCRCTLAFTLAHHNPHGVVHGAVLFAMADTGMGAALYPTLDAGEICATIEVKINYFKPVASGVLTCVTELVSRGKTIANMESSVYLNETLVAKANGNYAIFRPGASAALDAGRAAR
jgi:acyl-CoA thioesterase